MDKLKHIPNVSREEYKRRLDLGHRYRRIFLHELNGKTLSWIKDNCISVRLGPSLEYKRIME